MQEFQFLLYKTEQEDVSVNALIKDDTIWLTQKGMAELFGVQIPAINKHLSHIFADGELNKEVVISKMETTTPHGALDGKTQSKETMFYNLDAIISVGYRINSIRATHFRIWATNILKEYITKGFVLDDDVLNRAKPHLAKITLENFLKEFVRSEPANAEYGNRLQIYSQSAV